jgi:16S rRNA (uracil1498-N3)-methyltransferase
VTSAPVFFGARDALAADVIVLDGAEGRHAAVVRRVQVGEAVSVVDGQGLRVTGYVAEVHPDRVLVAVHERAQDPPPQPRLVVVQALAKGDRGERAVEAMTEVGVDEIVPWAASRSIVKWRGGKPLQKWRTTAREAAKQSRRSWFPVVADLADTEEVAKRLTTAALAIVCHESATAALSDVQLPASGDVVVVIGPEGSITDDELSTFEKSGGTTYRMGPTVFRTSTAGVVAASLLLSQTERWR